MPRLQEGIPVSRRRGGAASFSVRLQSTSGAAMSCVEASAADTVGALKERVCQLIGEEATPEVLRLERAGCPLLRLDDEARTLDDCGVGPDSVLTVGFSFLSSSYCGAAPSSGMACTQQKQPARSSKPDVLEDELDPRGVAWASLGTEYSRVVSTLE